MYPSKLLGCVARVSPEPHPSTLANTTLKGTVLPGYRAGHSNLSRLLGNVARVASSGCVHHWLVAPSEDWCDCSDYPEHHWHAWCQECASETTFPVYPEATHWQSRTGTAHEHAKRGAIGKWKGVETAEAPAE